MIRAALAFATAMALTASGMAQGGLRCVEVGILVTPPDTDAYGRALAKQMIDEMQGEAGHLPAHVVNGISGAYAIAGSGQVLVLVTMGPLLCSLPVVAREIYDRARRVVMGVAM